MAISLGVAMYAWRRKNVRGAASYGWAALGQAIWTFGYIFELISPSLEGKHFWDDFQWLGTLLLVTAFPVAILEYAGVRGPSSRSLWLRSTIFPAIFLAFLVTPGLHCFIHGEQQLVPAQPFSILVYDFTPLVWGILIYSYGVFFALLFILFREFVNRHRLYRAQIAIVMVGTAIPLVAAGLTISGVNLSAQRDITPFAFALQNLIVSWGLVRYGLFDIVPIARDTVIDKMTDLVVVLDARDRIVDINPSALRALNRNSGEVIGKPAEQVFADWPELITDFTPPSDKVIQTTLQGLGKTYYHEVNATRLFNRRGDYIGRVFVSRDITLHVEFETDLARLTDDLDKRVRKRTEELAEAYDTTLEGWARALELRDKEIEGHSRRVTELTLKLAVTLGVPPAELEHIRRGAILHDIGKMAIPDEILHKTSTLTYDEWQIISEHPTIAYELLSGIPFLEKAIDIPYCHHERWDGSGYPRGLKGEEIPLAARIFAVVDVWDAVQSDRSYKKGWPRQKAVEYLRQNAGSLFDARVVEVFLGMVEKEEDGL